jgi:hypothetical protein
MGKKQALLGSSPRLSLGNLPVFFLARSVASFCDSILICRCGPLSPLRLGISRPLQFGISRAFRLSLSCVLHLRLPLRLGLAGGLGLFDTLCLLGGALSQAGVATSTVFFVLAIIAEGDTAFARHKSKENIRSHVCGDRLADAVKIVDHLIVPPLGGTGARTSNIALSAVGNEYIAGAVVGECDLLFAKIASLRDAVRNTGLGVLACVEPRRLRRRSVNKQQHGQEKRREEHKRSSHLITPRCMFQSCSSGLRKDE